VQVQIKKAQSKSDIHIEEGKQHLENELSTKMSTEVKKIKLKSVQSYKPELVHDEVMEGEDHTSRGNQY